METENIVIIGAGIVGLSTALSLQKSGYQVTLIDREDPGMGRLSEMQVCLPTLPSPLPIAC